ncbi:MAG: rRNA adenine N-6-methyltransferase family protein [Allosphingosinicella sp.]
MPKHVIIGPQVRAVLERATFGGPTDRPVLKLNHPGLDRDLYAAVDKVLKALGGKWNRAAGGHVFDGEAVREFADAMATGVAVDQRRTAEQFFTPFPVAQRMFAIADLKPTDHVLEPSAGCGVLLVEPLRLGCFITVVEQDPGLAASLTDVMAGHHGCGVWQADFMKWSPTARAPIDVVLMNPPFSGNQDIRHVLRAFLFLRPGGRLVAIMSPHFTFANDRASHEMRALIGYSGTGGDRPTGSETVVDASVEQLPAGSFKAEGTNVSALLVHIIKAA